MVKITTFHGIVLRRASLLQRQVKLSEIFDALETTETVDSDELLLSFGPSFGEDAADVFTNRLTELGLRYIDDFFVFSGDFPEWCSFYASLEDAPSNT